MSTPKSPPPRIAGFTHIEGIGGGGFADVFLYTQHSTGRQVAVKVLRAEHLSEHSLQQFETEARVMAGVSTHPFIVTIHDAGIAEDGRPYLVMEHYPLPHFGRRASGGHLPISEVLRVGVQVASAVETAHRAGILHRDIKPANILTSTYGDPGLTDFGIAGVQSEQGLTSAAGVSYGFSAPEVVLDEYATGSVSSDVYALGATLFALLCGRSPLFVPGGDNTAATLVRRLSAGEIQPLKRDDAPRSLTHLLATTLAGQPGHRPRSAADLGAALRDIEQELRLPPTPLVLTGPDGPSTPALRPARGGDEDATRRAPKVVHAHEAPPPPAPAAEPAAPTPVPGDRFVEPRGAAPDPSTDRTVARRRASTLGEPVPAPPPATSATADHPRTPSADPDSPTDRSGPSWRVLAPAAAVLGAIALIAAILLSGGDDDIERGTPSTFAAAPLGGIATELGGSIRRPVITTLKQGADGALSVGWEAPTDLGNDTPVYTVYRADSGLDEVELAGPTAETAATISPSRWTSDPPADGKLCVQVVVAAGSRTSESDSSCLAIAVPTTAPGANP